MQGGGKGHEMQVTTEKMVDIGDKVHIRGYLLIHEPIWYLFSN